MGVVALLLLVAAGLAGYAHGGTPGRCLLKRMAERMRGRAYLPLDAPQTA